MQEILQSDIPEHFFRIRYNPNIIPSEAMDIDQGANCQVFAYSLLKNFGKILPPFRSSNLWEDQKYTVASKTPQPLSLLLFNNKNQHSFGAHIAVGLDNKSRIIHLSAKNQFAEITTVQDLMKLEEYRYLIGIKNIL